MMIKDFPMIIDNVCLICQTHAGDGPGDEPISGMLEHAIDEVSGGVLRLLSTLHSFNMLFGLISSTWAFIRSKKCIDSIVLMFHICYDLGTCCLSSIISLPVSGSVTLKVGTYKLIVYVPFGLISCMPFWVVSLKNYPGLKLNLMALIALPMLRDRALERR
jgi:hypothetical protein